MADRFVITPQKAYAIIKRESKSDVPQAVMASVKTGMATFLLATGAKLVYNRWDKEWVVYGYHYANEDTNPYRPSERTDKPTR